MTEKAPSRSSRSQPAAPRRHGKRAARAPRPFPRENRAQLAARAAILLTRLKTAYPESRCALRHQDPLQLLVATILSAQCTDSRVNQVTPALFRRFPTAADYAAAPLAELEQMIQSTGFFRNKARALKGLGQALMTDHDGRVPETMGELVALPGVGRKTANVVLGNAFGKDEGIVVDTHVPRLAGRLRLSRESDPEKIERDLMELFPRSQWTLLAHLLIDHGRQVCQARKPRCSECALADLCPSAELID